MNWKRLWLTALITFIFLQLTDFLIHWVILEGVYEDLAARGIFSSAGVICGYIWVEILMTALFSFFFTYIFVKGYEGKGVLEGVRYGIVIGFFWVFTNAYNAFVIIPIPYGLVWYWIIAGFIQTIIAGILAAIIYKPKQG
ncbi:MAG: hypothetical protein JSU85_13075 [Candidatus Zixiibacteriota bacterium]|nr:MAG: hypothetical protein JSU85_13075 [candidate division Zixibacteria bacterium]